MRIGPDTKYPSAKSTTVGAAAAKSQKREGVSVRFSERRSGSASAASRKPEVRDCAASAHGERVASNLKRAFGI